MRYKALVVYFATCFSLLAASPALAEIALAATVKEDFATAVKVSGGFLVGLAFGPTEGKADPRFIRIPLGSFVERTEVCMTAKTRDGQYWGQAAFAAPGDTEGDGVVMPTGGWKYIQELSAYDRRDLAVSARVGPDCAIDPAARYLPVTYGDARTELTAAINSQQAVTARAQLVLENQKTVEAKCDRAPPDVRSTAFNLVCTFDLRPLGAAKGPAQLTLQRRLLTGVREDSFDIVLPP
jgi:hypothetical protein